MASTVQFTLNGELRTVDLEEAVGRTLNEYIRTSTQYTGTKVSCAQGGCGACTVALARPSERLHSVASCIMPLASVHGAAVLTAEGLSAEDGKPHPVAERIAKFNGSQCGFCTPGMVMQLFSTLNAQDGGKACVEKDLEQCINGNICRCTGYRPIVECAKSFAAGTTITNQIDPSVAVGPYDAATSDPKISYPPANVPLSGSHWLRPTSLRELLHDMATRGAVPLAGGTAAGVYPDLGMAESGAAGRVWADISAVLELGKVIVEGDSMRIGATVTWTRFVESLKDVVSKGGAKNTAALVALQERCGSIAGSQVRNRATIGGNIAISRNKGFLSDWVPPLAALGAKVQFCQGGSSSPSEEDLLAFVQKDAAFDGLITAVLLPLPPAEIVFRSFRVAKRSRNAHALVNAAFAATITGGKVSQVTMIVGAVDPKPVRFKNTERALLGIKGDELQSNASTLVAGVCEKVKADLFALTCGFGREQSEHVISGFIIKFLVAAFGPQLPKEWQSSEYCLHDMQRTTTARQSFPTPDDLGGPLNKPLAKTTALEQAMGAAKYTDDMPKPEGTLVAALVLCPEANVSITGIDATLAKEMLGADFHSLVTADVLHENKLDMNEIIGLKIPPKYHDTWDTTQYLLLPKGEPSKFAGQPVALLLARGNRLRTVERAAVACSQALRFERKGSVAIGGLAGGSEVCDPLDAKKGKIPAAQVIATAKATGGENYITGKFEKKSQAHFYMECQSALVIPDEGGITCYAACQGADVVQRAICKATGLLQSKVVVKFRRVGGGFGGKLNLPAVLSALAAQVAIRVKLPVRLVLPRETDMAICGGRQELDSTWQVAVEPRTGKILALDYDIWLAHGAGEDMQKLMAHMIPAAIDEVYDIPSMAAKVHLVRQHLPSRTAVRAPGHFEATFLMEAVIDGVAASLGIPGHVVRERNFCQGRSNKSGMEGVLLPSGHLGGYSSLAMWSLIKAKTGYEKRVAATQDFNRANLFKKRGIALTPARYGMMLTPGNSARVDIFKDGSVQIAVSGAEIGQGLHTKVGQMVSTMFHRELGAGPPMHCLRFLDTATEQNPNGMITGGSTTSEGAMFAAGEAVRQLVERLQGSAKKARKLTAEQKKKDGPWFDIIEAAFDTKFMGVLVVPQNLSAVGMHMTLATEMMYETYGVAAAEVELDVLTGEWRVRFAHLMFDVGQSYNPMVDIGQMEGAFVMGLGQCMHEGVDFDHATGKLLSDNTWTYKPPIACDIPEDFTVELMDMRKERLENPMMSVAMCAAGPVLRCLGMPWKATHTKAVYKSSKAIGEPPTLLASAVQSALANAMVAATGSPLPDHKLPMPAKPFMVLPLLEALHPVSSLIRDGESTATGASVVSAML